MSRISIAPPGVTVLPAAAILTGHITVPFLSSFSFAILIRQS